MTFRQLMRAAGVVAMVMSAACLVPVSVGSDDGGSVGHGGGGSGGSTGGAGGSGGLGGEGGGSPTCDGCIDGATGFCHLGTTATACGLGGVSCAICESWQVCGNGVCQHGTPVCTVGQDFTCNDVLAMSSLAGHCQADGSCACNAGMEINPTTGRCRPASFTRTVCEAQGCGSGFREADGGTISGWCGTQSMGPGCTCAYDTSTHDYHPLCTGACLPDAGAACVTVNCGTANCMDSSPSSTLLATTCAGWGQCEYLGVPPVSTPCGGATCGPGQFCQRQYPGTIMADGGSSGLFDLGCVTPTGPCTPSSTCSDRVCFATDPCQTQCADLQISDAGVFIDCRGV